uniref:Pentacotripeptide-repeat region of PRORP domain-containing protein n=1 Tax=Rhodosorus marinus TaxID=101924 RepID=A0A7S2ZES8_9RHOD|mmetsp:Transcript_17147/g.69431  ORF Transcript_17147/g.69431 Transcript_17147/m.69431 type:complete len:291 (+) Transcript_17147:186-1058(+)
MACFIDAVVLHREDIRRELAVCLRRPDGYVNRKQRDISRVPKLDIVAPSIPIRPVPGDGTEFLDPEFLEHAKSAPNTTPDCRRNLKMLRTLVSRQNMKQAIMYMDELRSAGKANVYIYNFMISAIGRFGDIDQALELKEEMERRKILPDTFTYSALISAFSRANKPTKSEAMFIEMISRKVKPNVVTFGALMSVYAKQGLVDLAEQAMDHMEKENIEKNAVVYNTLALAYAKAGCLEKLKGVLNAMHMHSVWNPLAKDESESPSLLRKPLFSMLGGSAIRSCPIRQRTTP